jgi:DNA-binding GntR family transcriptional regulator
MTVADRIYAELRRAIVEGRYRPHQRLVETDLAADLSASRTPIRQGLQRLELEGLVVAARFGWIVREHSEAEIREIYDVRVSLEGTAARLAAERATPEQLQQLRGIHESALRNLDPADRPKFVTLHDELHDMIFQAAHNEVLREAIRRYREHPYNMRVAQSYADDELRQAVESHADLVEAICAGDADRAERLGREHLLLSREATLRRVQLR